jgi:uncharacterized membrane protein YcjF (UPF0283 family)
MTDRETSPNVSFFSTAQGRIVAALSIIALLGGIAAEGVSIWRNIQEAKTATEVANFANRRQQAEAEKAKAEVCSARLKNVADSTGLNVMTSLLAKIMRECEPYLRQTP